MRMMPTGDALLSLVCLAACATGPAEEPGPFLEFRLSSSVYAVGGVITGEVVNVSGATLYLNACMMRLERAQGGRWVAEPTPPDATPCTAQLSSLAPSARLSLQHRLPGTITPGRYRVVLDGVWDSADRLLPVEERASPGFLVDPTPSTDGPPPG